LQPLPFEGLYNITIQLSANESSFNPQSLNVTMPVTAFKDEDPYQYLMGFGNYHQYEERTTRAAASAMH